jgi:hypothetical protein
MRQPCCLSEQWVVYNCAEHGKLGLVCNLYVFQNEVELKRQAMVGNVMGVPLSVASPNSMRTSSGAASAVFALQIRWIIRNIVIIAAVRM